MVPATMLLTARMGMLAGIFVPLALQIVCCFAWSFVPFWPAFPPAATMIIPTAFLPVLPSGEPLGADVGTGWLARDLRLDVRRGVGDRSGAFRGADDHRRCVAFEGGGAVMTGFRDKGAAGRMPRVTLGRALHAETLRLRRSPLVALHIICGIVAGLACGAYFSVAAWNPSLGADAYVQLLGAMMPLMVSIVCGLDIDAEREVGAMGNLLATPARRTRLTARLVILLLMGMAALLIAIFVFGAVLLAAEG